MVIRSFQKPLERLVAESVMIEAGGADLIMNSKSEWGASRIPRLTLEVGERVTQVDFKGRKQEVRRINQHQPPTKPAILQPLETGAKSKEEPMENNINKVSQVSDTDSSQEEVPCTTSQREEVSTEVPNNSNGTKRMNEHETVEPQPKRQRVMTSWLPSTPDSRNQVRTARSRTKMIPDVQPSSRQTPLQLWLASAVRTRQPL